MENHAANAYESLDIQIENSLAEMVRLVKEISESGRWIAAVGKRMGSKVK